MQKKYRLVLNCIVLIVFIASHCQGDNNVDEIVIKPTKVCEFFVGDTSDKQIPNIDEGADLYTSPRNLVVDNTGNIYIFIVGENRIIKITADGEDVKNYYFSNLRDIKAITFDRVTIGYMHFKMIKLLHLAQTLK